LISLDKSQNSLTNYRDNNISDFGWCITQLYSELFIDIDCVQQTLHTPRPEHIVVSNIKIIFPPNFSISFYVENAPAEYNRKKLDGLFESLADNGLQEFIEIKNGLKSYVHFDFKHSDESFKIVVTCRRLGPRDGTGFQWRFSSLLRQINESVFNPKKQA